MASPIPIGPIQTDSQGRQFLPMSDGSRNYISPVAFGGTAPTDHNVFQSRPEWNTGSGEWDTPVDWGKLATLGTAGVLGAGAIDAFAGGAGAASGAGGASAGTGGTLPATTIGTGSLGPIAGGTGLAGVDTALGSGVGTGLGAAAGAAGSAAASAAPSGFSASDLLKLLGVGGAALGGALSQNHASYPPALDDILALQKQRLDAQTPLYNSILKLSQSRLPTAVQG